MGENERREVSEPTRNTRVAAMWLQFALLLAALIGFAMRSEGRLSRIEQRLDDSDAVRTEMRQQLDRIERLIDSRIK